MSGYITFEERLEIESMIFQRCSFGEIAKKINKDRSTISREIRRRSVESFEFYYGSELFEKLGYKQIEKKQVIINPKLLKR